MSHILAVFHHIFLADESELISGILEEPLNPCYAESTSLFIYEVSAE